MDFLKELLPIIFMFVVIPALGILTTFIVAFINKKKEELQEKIDNDLLKKYIEMLARTVTTCVVATNQTYVNSLKKQGKFDKEAQIIAFNMTKDAVMEILSEEAVHYLTVFYGDLETAISNLIEENVAEAYNREPETLESLVQVNEGDNNGIFSATNNAPAEDAGGILAQG